MCGTTFFDELSLLCGVGGLVLEVVTEREHLRATPETPNIIFVVMDTLRADRTNLDGYERDTTPHLARFAERAIIYENAISTSSWTWPATASFLTGLPPEAHGVLLQESAAMWIRKRTNGAPDGIAEMAPRVPLSTSHENTGKS